MGLFSKIAELFRSKRTNEEMEKDSIDLLEDELNFEDRSAGVYRLNLENTERLKEALKKYDFEHRGIDEDGAVIIDDGVVRLKIKEVEDRLEIFELN